MKSARFVFLLLPLLAASCTEPQFEECAGSDCAPTAVRDRDAAVPSPRELLVGRYAVRAQFYGVDRTTQSLLTHEILLLAEIAHDSARDVLTFEHQACANRSEVLAAEGPPLHARALYPERLPTRKLDIRFEGAKFHTVGPPVLFGYEAAAPAACAPGKEIRRSTPVPWGTTCTCPLSDVPPTSSSDCRVIDADGDGVPGFTVQLSGPIQATNAMRVKDMSQIVDGVVDPQRRHTGSFVRVADEGLLECPQDSCRGMTLSLCPTKLNPVEFAPLAETAPSGESWSCAEVVTELEAGRLLPVRPLAFPSGC